MAYLSGYEHDIFISYAHVDNLTIPPEEQGWVSRLHEYLEIRLSQRIGRVGVVNIWRDPNLDGSQLFDQTIKTAVEKSAILIALTSNGHLSSDYCQDELAWFAEKVKAEPVGAKIGDRSRMINCLINNIPHTKWPDHFAGTSGFPLYLAEDRDDLGEPTAPGTPEFNKQIRKLVDTLYDLLMDFEKTLASSAAAPPAGNGAGKEEDGDCLKVYLADVPDSLRLLRKRIIAELGDEAAEILPAVPPPYPPAEHEAALKETLKKADLSIHLLDEYAGRELEGGLSETYPQKQVEIGAGLKVNQYIWVPKDLDIDALEDVDHQKVLKALAENADREAVYDFVRSTPTAIRRDLLDRLEALRVPPVPEPAAGHHRLAAALLDTHIKDQLHALELSRFLLENHVQPFVVPQDDDPQQTLKIFEVSLQQTLEKAGIPIVFFGNVDEEWVRERLGHVAKTAISNGWPLKECAIYLAPPKKNPGSFELGFLKVHVLDNSKEFNPNTLLPLIGDAA